MDSNDYVLLNKIALLETKIELMRSDVLSIQDDVDGIPLDWFQMKSDGDSKISGVVVSNGKIWISVSNATFTDSITLATYRTDAALPTATETHDYAYIKVPFDGSAPQWKDTADFIAGGNNDANAEWFCVAGMSGDIHVDRA